MHLFRVYKAKFVLAMAVECDQGGMRALALTEHVEIVAAIAGGNSDSARDLMLHHIESSRRRFIPAIEAVDYTALRRT